MPLTSAQQARNHYAGLIRGGAPPEQIERARTALEYAKARQAVTSWACLSLTHRARLAAQLLASDGHDTA